MASGLLVVSRCDQLGGDLRMVGDHLGDLDDASRSTTVERTWVARARRSRLVWRGSRSHCLSMVGVAEHQSFDASLCGDGNSLVAVTDCDEDLLGDGDPCLDDVVGMLHFRGAAYAGLVSVCMAWGKATRVVASTSRDGCARGRIDRSTSDLWIDLDRSGIVLRRFEWTWVEFGPVRSIADDGARHVPDWFRTFVDRANCRLVRRLRWRLRLLAVSCGTLFVVWFAWSGIAAESMPLSDLLLHRLLRLSLVSVVVAMALSWTLARTTSRIPEAWRSVLRRQWSILAALSAVAILVSIILLRESYRATGEKSAYSAEVLCILLALMLWMVQWVVQALRASWNVARLEDRWKELYVYAAEACLVMGLGLAYAQFSEWFELPFREYWPIGLLLVAVASQGVATMVRRAGILAISNPLQNTSLVLPLLASMGVLFIAADVKADVVFLLSAFFYFAMGAADGSRRFAVLGVTFANIALALFWNRIPSLDFAEHPQLWVIPPAVSVLAATHVYRNQWKAEVTTWIRYLAVLTIFMSSTFEVLIVGFGKQLWPPMILMVLSVLTVFLGMVLRVRSYLFSGVLFLLVSVTSMVAHAQQSLQHTWPWWVLGISLGTGILVLYGVFEKKREQFRELSDQLRRWQP